MEKKQYILPPHPVAKMPYKEEFVHPELPVMAEDSISDLVHQAVEELRDELKEELRNEQERGLESDAQNNKS